MYHGLKCEPSGRCIEIPGQATIPDRARVRRYPAVDRHSWVWVWMGDASLADPALIPAAVGLDDPAWTLRSGRIDYQANHMLIHDNLCDFSHIASQAVTGMTERTSRYFYSWGPRACEGQVTPRMSETMFNLAVRAFEEDRQMIEAQQRNLNLRPSRSRS